MTYFVMALALVLGFTQCKKEQMPANNQTEGIRITLDVNGGNSNSRVIVDPAGAEGYATVAFEDDDVIYVGYNNAYVGTLTYSNGTFGGTVNISEIVGDEHLHFYFLGGVGFEPTVDGNTATVVISDQTQKLPVISYSPSNETFTGAGAYSAKLQNKISIMKFNVTTPSTAPICITGMNNKVTVDFGNPTDEGFEYGMDGEGVIEMPAKDANNETWAIVLPQEALPEGAVGTAYTYDGYKGNRPELEEITSNQYITTGVDDLDVSTFDINYMAFTFEANQANSKVTFTATSMTPAITMQYNTYDGTGWKPYTSGTAITLSATGDKVSFRGDNNTLASEPYSYGSSSKFSTTGKCFIYGNIMSLLYSNDYPTATTLIGDYTFCSLFFQNMNIYSHSSKALVLPATTLTTMCYYQMFINCRNLTSAPMLPATTLADNCYSSMFYGCMNLTSAPAELPATTLTYGCYSNMFEECSKLTSAPALPATTLAPYCYYRMFVGCRSSSFTSAPSLPATTLAPYCYSNMFNGCSYLTSAPTLPATTLADYCYEEMFNGCKLSSAPALPAETLADHCYSCMFFRCRNLTSAPALPATTLAPYCYSNMFNGCSSLESVPALPATTLADYCYQEMFSGCNNPFFENATPELPAPTLVTGCYERMFYDTDVQYIKCLATDISAEDCTNEWLENLMSSDGTFVKATSMTGWERGGSGIPDGWNVVNAN